MKRFISLLLAGGLCLSLAACGKQTGLAAKRNVLESSAGIPVEDTLLTVDGRAVAAGQYLYWLAAVCDEIAAYYEAAEKPLDWGEALESGTLGEYAKNQALRSAALYAVVEAWAEQYGCAVTEEDRAAMAADWDAKAAEHGGEEAYLALLARKGLDRAGAEHLAEDHYLYVQLCTLAETSDDLIPQEDLKAFFREQGYLTVDLLLLNGEGAAEKAAELFSRLNESPDPAAEFAALRTDSAYPRTLLPTDGTLPEGFDGAAADLAEGQLSGILESGEGYGILLRLPDDVDAVRQDLLDHRLQTAADEAAIQAADAYQALDTADFWSGLEQARAELSAA